MMKTVLRRFCALLCTLVLCMPLPAWAAETSYDQAISSAKAGDVITLTQDVDMLTLDCKAGGVVTIDAQGHSIGLMVAKRGSFLVCSAAIIQLQLDSTAKLSIELDKNCTVSNGVVAAESCQSSISITNHGTLSTIGLMGMKASFTLNNHGVVTHPYAAVLLGDRRGSKGYIKSGAVVIHNDGEISAPTGVAIMVGFDGGTPLTVDGSGVISGATAVWIRSGIYTKAASKITLDNRIEAHAITDERTLWQVEANMSSVHGILEEYNGVAVALVKMDQRILNHQLTLRGTLWADERVLSLPDMYNKPQKLSLKPQIAPDSPSRTVLFQYEYVEKGLTPDGLPALIQKLGKKHFGGALPQGAEVRFLYPRNENGGDTIYYSTTRDSFALSGYHAVPTRDGWTVTAFDPPMPLPTQSTDSVLAQMLRSTPKGSIILLDESFTTGARSDFSCGGEARTVIGQGYNVSGKWELDNFSSLTLRDFGQINHLELQGNASAKKVSVVLDGLAIRKRLDIRLAEKSDRMDVTVSRLSFAQHMEEEQAFAFSSEYGGKHTLTLEQDVELGSAYFSTAAHKGDVTVVNNVYLDNAGLNAGTDYQKKAKGSVNLTGTGSAGYLSAWLYHGGSIIVDQQVEHLHVRMGDLADPENTLPMKLVIDHPIEWLELELRLRFAKDLTLELNASVQRVTLRPNGGVAIEFDNLQDAADYLRSEHGVKVKGI